MSELQLTIDYNVARLCQGHESPSLLSFGDSFHWASLGVTSNDQVVNTNTPRGNGENSFVLLNINKMVVCHFQRRLAAAGSLNLQKGLRCQPGMMTKPIYAFILTVAYQNFISDFQILHGNLTSALNLDRCIA